MKQKRNENSITFYKNKTKQKNCFFKVNSYLYLNLNRSERRCFIYYFTRLFADCPEFECANMWNRAWVYIKCNLQALVYDILAQITASLVTS